MKGATHPKRSREATGGQEEGKKRHERSRERVIGGKRGPQDIKARRRQKRTREKKTDETTGRRRSRQEEAGENKKKPDNPSKRRGKKKERKRRKLTHSKRSRGFLRLPFHFR